MPESITVVDDVITRGSSFVGAYPRLRSAFPGIPIHCFALVRTISGRDIDGILDPVAGLITHENGQRLHREP
jgi:orotate phosphoribosyltransferase-like protein